MKRDQENKSCRVEFSASKSDKRSNQKWNYDRNDVIGWKIDKEVVRKNPKE